MGIIGNVDTVNLVVRDMYQSYRKTDPNYEARQEAERKKTAEERAKDPFAAVDEAISGAFVSLGRGLGQTMKPVGESIADGAKWAYDGVTGAVRNTVTALGNFAERTGNFFAEGHFASDAEVAEIQARQRIQKAVKNGSALEDGSEEYNMVMAELNGKPVPKVGNSGTGDLSRSEEIRKLKEMDRTLNGGGMSEGANSKAVEDIMEKIRDGKPVDASDLQKLTATMLQKNTLSKEVLDSILNDKKAFQQLAGKTFDFGENGTVKPDLNDPESIKAYAENISKVYCVAASLYGQMVVNGIGGTPDSFGEFTKQLLEKGLVDPSKPARQMESTQNIIDAFSGKGNYQVVGYGVDAGGGYFNDENDVSTANYKGNIFDKLIDTASTNKDINFFNTRINSPHNMNLFNDNGNLSIYDTSKRGFNAPLMGNIKNTNIKSWYYIRPSRRN